MIVYNQKEKEDQKTNVKYYLGEDTLPYERDGILLVADGLGGRGGYPHTEFKTCVFAIGEDDRVYPTPLNADNFYDLLFEDIFRDNDDNVVDVDDEFKKYVTDSFKELIELLENGNYAQYPKCSGYFASRLVAAIALYEIEYFPLINVSDFFIEIKKHPEYIQDIIDTLASKLTKAIKLKLQKIASEWGLKIETSVIGAYLLPSTINIAIVNEEKDKLDVIYLWAGDSRAYVWDRQKGLGQITEDHEKGETMYNLVNLTNDFTLEARYVEYDKPCVLFNASDGCYKCNCYSSPLQMELTILNAIKDSESFDETSLKLREQYKLIGKHDDSNTMALHAYGYGDDAASTFKALKKDAIERIKDIEELIKVLPDVLTTNYEAKEQELEYKKDSYLKSKASEWIELPSVKAFVKKLMIESEYQPYLDAVKNYKKPESPEAQEIYVGEDLIMALQNFWRENISLIDINVYKAYNYESFAGAFIAGKLNADNVLAANVRDPRVIMKLKNLERKVRGGAREETPSDLDAVVDSLVMRYWRVNKTNCLNVILEHRDEALVTGSDAYVELEKELIKLKNEAGEVLEQLELRDGIYNAYDKNYYRFYREARIKK